MVYGSSLSNLLVQFASPWLCWWWPACALNQTHQYRSGHTGTVRGAIHAKKKLQRNFLTCSTTLPIAILTLIHIRDKCRHIINLPEIPTSGNLRNIYDDELILFADDNVKHVRICEIFCVRGKNRILTWGICKMKTNRGARMSFSSKEKCTFLFEFEKKRLPPFRPPMGEEYVRICKRILRRGGKNRTFTYRICKMMANWGARMSLLPEEKCTFLVEFDKTTSPPSDPRWEKHMWGFEKDFV